jgi:hypothetical protein
MMNHSVTEIIGETTGKCMLLSLFVPVDISGEALNVGEIGREVSGSLS